jgi:CubicO group peptidase (beta-lactamase class C family)
VERHIPATPDTAFEAASIAKTILATCVMQLVEEGRLDLDVEISRYVGFTVRHPRWPDPITLRLLLTHRASIADREGEIAAGREGHPLDAFLKGYLIEGRRPRAAAFHPARPGTVAAYSNVGAALAALAVEHVGGESFAAWSTRRVFLPLRMTNTGWTAAPRDGVLFATPHAARDGGFTPLPQASHALYPVVDLRSSARDLARFARAILREGELDGTRILAPSSVRAMLRPADDAGGDQALAWQLRELGGARVAGHEGEDRGATTALFLDPVAGTGAVVLGNGDAFSSGDRERTAAIEGLLADLLASAR